MTAFILNGTPLPKGHGDLIDKSEVIISLFDYYNGKKTMGQCIDEVQTIIEADKTESDGIIISRNLCDSCINNGYIFQSGIVRNHCDFYKEESEDKA